MMGVVPAAGHLRNIAEKIAEAFDMCAPSDYDTAGEIAALEVAKYVREELGFEVDQ
jgi:hypothetical protein